MTDDVEGPRLADAGEFPEILALVDRCFNRASGGTRAAQPYIFDPDRPERHAVVTRDGRVIAHVACIPDTLVCGPGAALSCWGVSGVATDPRHTGEGHMSTLASFWLDRMDDAGVPLAKLWGDRARYGRFGFETVGRERHFRITPRSFPDPPDRDAAVTHVTREHGDGSADGRITGSDGDGWLDEIPDLHARTPYRVARTRADFGPLFAQRGLEVLGYDDGDARAYLAFRTSRRERTVTEVAGDPAGVEGLLGYLFRAYYTDEVSVMLHPRDPVCDVVRPLSVDWTDHTHKQLRVNDLPAILDALAPQIARRLPDSPAPGAVTLGIEEGERVRLRWNVAGDVEVIPSEDDPDVELSRPETARLLFERGLGEGPGSATDSIALPRVLRESVLPLSFFVPRTEWV